MLVSSCGLWEMDNSDLLIDYMKKGLCKHVEREFAGALLRPHVGALRGMMKMGKSVDDIFEAAKKAGRQLIIDGKLPPETLEIVSRSLVPPKKWIELDNRNWQKTIKAGRWPPP